MTGNKDIKIGKSIEPETSDISTYDFAENDDLEVSLVDTPGFDDNRAHMSDSKLLQDLIEFLLKRYVLRLSCVDLSDVLVFNLKGVTQKL